MPMPIDLQVLFTKATEHSENIARTTNATHAVQLMNNEKTAQNSREVTEKVDKMDQYDGEFTKTDAEGHGNTGEGHESGKKKEVETIDESGIKGYKPAEKEEGTGLIIDIIE